jgi:hypothetical protein
MLLFYIGAIVAIPTQVNLNNFHAFNSSNNLVHVLRTVWAPGVDFYLRNSTFENLYSNTGLFVSRNAKSVTLENITIKN